MQGRTSDGDRARELMSDDDPAWENFRPDVLGSLSASHDADAVDDGDLLHQRGRRAGR